MSNETEETKKPDVAFTLDLLALLADAKDRLVGAAIQDVRARMTYEVNNALATSVGAIVKEFIAKEIAPVVNERLLNQKSAIIEAAVAEVPSLAQAVAKAVIDTMCDNLARSHVRSEIIKKLTGGY